MPVAGAASTHYFDSSKVSGASSRRLAASKNSSGASASFRRSADSGDGLSSSLRKSVDTKEDETKETKVYTRSGHKTVSFVDNSTIETKSGINESQPNDEN